MKFVHGAVRTRFESLCLAGASSKLMSIPSVSRSVSLLMLLFLSTQCAFFGSQSFAQKLNKLDAAVSVFGQSTQATSGNGIHDSPTESMGGLATLRQSFKPWLGYELNYSYTRFSERYSDFPFAVQDNVHEATGAYLVQGPKLLVFQPFATVGGGWMIYLPTNTGGQHFNQQFQLALLYELGVNYPLVTDHFGLRLQYRGLVHKTPSFNQPNLVTGATRQTSEVAAGFYLRF
jgi:hypothetical protein